MECLTDRRRAYHNDIHTYIHVPPSRITKPMIGAESVEGFACIANFNSSIRDSLAGLSSLLVCGSTRQLMGKV